MPEESLYRIWLNRKVQESHVDDIPQVDLTEEDCEIIWEWTNRVGPANCWATESAKVAGWMRLLLVDLEVSKAIGAKNANV